MSSKLDVIEAKLSTIEASLQRRIQDVLDLDNIFSQRIIPPLPHEIRMQTSNIALVLEELKSLLGVVKEYRQEVKRLLEHGSDCKQG